MASVKRLIYDEDAKQRIIALAVGHHTDTLPLDMIINVILHQSTTVDAVEVVRCKDCKHLWITKQTKSKFCNVWCTFQNMRDDNFCSYGERKV